MTIVVYHQISDQIPCDDGFCSAFILWLKYGYSAEYIPAFYHKRIPLETFRDHDVFIVDFCYPKDYLESIREVAASLVVLDHQRSAEFLQDSWYARIDTTKSSCQLVWDFVFPSQPLPLLVQQVMEHTLGDADAYTRAFIARLRSLPYTFEAWSQLNSALVDKTCAEYKDFILRGTSFLEGHDVQCRQLAASAFPITLNGTTGLAVNAPKFFAKDVGIELARKSTTFGAVFFMRDDGHVQFELRSVSFDVERLARYFGGGGHETCAGFSLPALDFQALLDPQVEHLSFYAQLSSALATYSYSGPLSADAVHADLVRYLLNVGKIALVNVQTTLLYEKSFGNTLARAARAVATSVFRLPVISHKPAWYHKLFYQVSSKPALDLTDDQIGDLLRSGTYTEENSAELAAFFLESVKFEYEARLRKPRCSILLRVSPFGGSTFFNKTIEV